MTDITTPFTFNSYGDGCIQALPCLAYTPTWTAKPKNWSITPANQPLINQMLNTSVGEQFDSPNVHVSFVNAIRLNYPFTSFYINFTDNPNVQNGITQLPFTWSLANSVISSLRKVANFSIFSQYTFNSIPNVNETLKLTGSVNGYTINTVVYNTTGTAGKYYLQVPVSNYINPNITIVINASYVKQSPAYFTQTDLYCPLTASINSAGNFQAGLVDANGTKYTFYVSSASGSVLSGDLMQIIEQSGVHTVQVQSLQLPNTTPFTSPLEGAGESYAFDITNPQCTAYYYKGGLSQPSNPIYIFVNQLTGAYIYNVSKVFGACKITNPNTTGTYYNVLCVGGDPTDLTYEWKLAVFKITTVVGTQIQVYNASASGSALQLNFTLPKTNNSYAYTLLAYTDKSNDPVIGVNGGPLNFHEITVSSPLWGFLALILGLVVLFVGAISGKAIIILGLLVALIGAIGFFTPIQIPFYVLMAMIIISAIAIYYVRKRG